MAKARNIGNIYAELSVKDKMTVGIKRAEKALASFGKGLVSIGQTAILAAPAAAIAGLAVSMKSAIDAGGKLSDMMARTGADGEKLFVMQRAFENAGISGDKVPGVLNKMQKALAGVNEEGERVQSRVFQDLGLSIAGLQSMDSAGAFAKISQAIAAIPDPSKRAALAMEIFGRSGGELLVLMNDGNAFKTAATQVGGLAKTLSDNAAELDNVSDSLQLMQVKLQQVGAEVAVELLPVLTDFANSINSLDLSDVTSDAIEYAKAIGSIASKMADVAKELPGFKQASIASDLIGKGIGYAASFNPDGGKALAPAAFTIGGDPMSNYNEGVMLQDVGKPNENIPEFLRKRKELTFQPRLEDSGIPFIADMMSVVIDKISAAPVTDNREIGDITGIAAGVNEAQARGLGFGSMNVAPEVDKQISILEDIREELKKQRRDKAGATF